MDLLLFEFKNGFIRFGISSCQPECGFVQGVHIAPAFCGVVLRAMELKNKYLFAFESRHMRIVSMRWVDDLFMSLMFCFDIHQWTHGNFLRFSRYICDFRRCQIIDAFNGIGLDLKVEDPDDFAGMRVTCVDNLLVLTPKTKFPLGFQNWCSYSRKSLEIGILKGQLCSAYDRTLGIPKLSTFLDTIQKFAAVGFPLHVLRRSCGELVAGSTFLSGLAVDAIKDKDFWCRLSLSLL